jgi:hypothetical protein
MHMEVLSFPRSGFYRRLPEVGSARYQEKNAPARFRFYCEQWSDKPRLFFERKPTNELGPSLTDLSPSKLGEQRWGQI